MEEKEIFRGHIKECLEHFSNTLSLHAPKGFRKAALFQKKVADFCGIKPDSVRVWIYRNGIPDGETLIKLMCYLDIIGYRVIELERMSKVKRNFAELIGFDIFSSTDATKLIGYYKNSHLYKALKGTRGISSEKENKMWDVWKERKDKLEQKKKEAKELHCWDIPNVDLKVEEIKTTTLNSHQVAVVKIMEGLLVLLEEGLLDKISASNFADLQKEESTINTILNLSARLSTLSSRLLVTSEQNIEKERR